MCISKHARRVDVQEPKVQRIHNSGTNIMPINWILGDYVMIIGARRHYHKILLSWRGPIKIVRGIPSTVFEMGNLIQSKKQTVHAQRLLPYPMSHQTETYSDELLEYAKYAR